MPPMENPRRHFLPGMDAMARYRSIRWSYPAQGAIALQIEICSREGIAVRVGQPHDRLRRSRIDLNK